MNPPRLPVDPSSSDTREIVGALQQVPYRPRPVLHPAHWPLQLRSVADYVLQTPGWLNQLRTRMVGYPRPFHKVRFPSLDGTELTGWIGMHTQTAAASDDGRRGPPETREGLLIVPGMFTTKDNVIQKARALKIFRDWGYHVFAMDLRGFGESKRVFNTCGWKESEDVVAAIREFRKRVPVHRVHVYSESLGASAALVAAGQAAKEGRPFIDGGLLAVCPFADARMEAEYLSRKPMLTSNFYMVQRFFIQLLRWGGERRYSDFLDYLSDAARHYGVEEHELYERGSPKNVVSDITTRTLLLAADDDPVVPKAQGDLFEHLLSKEANPAIWRLPKGSHCLFEMVDPEWFWNVLREFFDFCCLLPRRA